MAEACASRTHRRHQRCLPPVLKTGRVTGPHALPFIRGLRNAPLRCAAAPSRAESRYRGAPPPLTPKQFLVSRSQFPVKRQHLAAEVVGSNIERAIVTLIPTSSPPRP